MIWQVRANLYFEIEDEGEDFYHDCELAFAKSIIINPNTANREDGKIELIINHHDQSPPQPCEMFASRSTTEPEYHIVSEGV